MKGSHMMLVALASISAFLAGCDQPVDAELNGDIDDEDAMGLSISEWAIGTAIDDRSILWEDTGLEGIAFYS